MQTRAGWRRWAATAMVAACAAVLSGCGGGASYEDDGNDPPASCSLADQQAWLRDYMDSWYFWYASHPDPNPFAYSSVDSYFQALLYTGTQSPFPADRWSYTESTTSHDQFFGEGRTLGYGLFVAGLEVQGQAGRPLRVRYLEPQSPAAAAGLQRGDELLWVNGRAASDMVANSDFAVLTAQAAGDRVTVTWRDASNAQHTAQLTALVYDLTPVGAPVVYAEASGRHTGYLLVKDFISQAAPALESAFQQFKAQGVDDLVLDLRYNGGGLVNTATTLASYVGGSRTANLPFASLLYNDQHADQNQTLRFASLASALGVNRVYVLAGQRTCSASELVINGLRPYVDVVVIGDTTCGKPVGFLPISRCGTTYNAVNFEAVNARNEGRYFDGFAPTCAVADDLDHPLGASNEALLEAARTYALYGACPTGSAKAQIQSLRPRKQRPAVDSEGNRSGMTLR